MYSLTAPLKESYEAERPIRQPTRCICVWTTPPSSRSEEVSPGVVLDYNESNEVVGVEMRYLSKRSPNLNLSTLQFETA